MCYGTQLSRRSYADERVWVERGDSVLQARNTREHDYATIFVSKLMYRCSESTAAAAAAAAVDTAAEL